MMLKRLMSGKKQNDIFSIYFCKISAFYSFLPQQPSWGGRTPRSFGASTCGTSFHHQWVWNSALVNMFSSFAGKPLAAEGESPVREKPPVWFWCLYCGTSGSSPSFFSPPCLNVPHSIWGSYPTRLGAVGLGWGICEFLEGMIRDSQAAGDNVRFCLKDETEDVFFSLFLPPSLPLSLFLSAGRSETSMDRWIMNFSKENTDWTSPSVKLASNQFINVSSSSKQMLNSDFRCVLDYYFWWILNIHILNVGVTPISLDWGTWH